MDAEKGIEPSGTSTTIEPNVEEVAKGVPLETGLGSQTGSVQNEPNTASVREQDDFHPGVRLWIIILSLGVTLLLTALENTVVAVAGPYIVADLHMGEDYIWITNAFFICRYVWLCRH